MTSALCNYRSRFVLIIALPSLPIFRQLLKHAQNGRIAILDYSVTPNGEAVYSYAQLLHDVAKFRDELVCFVGKNDLEGGRVSFLVESGYNYVVTLFTIWALGGFAVPLCTSHPVHEMAYMATDSDSCLLLANAHFEPKIRELSEGLSKDSDANRPLYIVPHHPPVATSNILELLDSPIADPMRKALMIYTSGTTGKPKV